MNHPLRLGIAGLGTVGTGLVKLIDRQSNQLASRLGRGIEIVAVSARTRDKDRGIDISRYVWFDDPLELAKSEDIDAFVELIGGEGGIAKDSVETALSAGKHVVTANKALLAHHGTELAARAEERGVALNFEASVAGSIPIIKSLRESFLGNEVRRVFGILNGTCNYILTKMEQEGRGYDEVLKEAQDAGYAEADPAFDVDGHDTAHKLAILTSLAFGTEISFDSIYVEGISTITPEDIEAADDLGYRIKLLGVAQKTDSGIEQRVHPTMVPKHSAMAEVDGVTNCVAVQADAAGDVMLIGPGAGADPTASSVMSDIIDIARGTILPPLIVPSAHLSPYKPARMRSHEGGYYIRLSVLDRHGAFAAIAQRMAEQEISLESIMQKRPRTALPGIDASRSPGDTLPVVMINHETLEAAIRKALTAIESDGQITSKPQMIRIEKL